MKGNIMSTNKKNRAFFEYDFILFNSTNARNYFKAVRKAANEYAKCKGKVNDKLASFNNVPLESCDMVNPYTMRTNVITSDEKYEYDHELIFSCEFNYVPEALTEREKNDLRMLSIIEIAAPEQLTEDDKIKMYNLKKRDAASNEPIKVRIFFDELFNDDMELLKALAANFIRDKNLTNHYFN